MPSRQLPRRFSILAGALAAIALGLTVAGCSHVTPLGPDAAPAMPQPRHLKSPIVLQAVLGRPSSSPGGRCPAGYVALSDLATGNTGLCYSKLGAPVTFTSAGVSTGQLKNSAGQPDASTGAEATLMFNLPAADRAALTAITTKAYQAKGYVEVSVAGQTWAIPEAMAPLTQGEFAISLTSKSEVLQLQRLLDPPS
ncbi:MAG: hypothetical protein ABSA02_29455 [Trebonia sp.]